ncbi:MAG: DegT/DnrJ/EryC1/StrS family aminotransferase [Vicinamibacterales bacterium]
MTDCVSRLFRDGDEPGAYRVCLETGDHGQDGEPFYFNLDPEAAKAAITARTRAIIPVHFAGQAADMDAIMAIARDHELIVIEEDPDETGLRALHILSHLRVALHLTGSSQHRARYQAAYDDLVRTHRYHWLTRNQKVMVPGSINHSDDELAFLSYYPLLRYETDPKLLEVYMDSLERSWQIERPERNPLWSVIYAVGTGAKEFDQAESIRTLQEIPMDMIQWSVTNSHRLDVPIDPLSDRFKRPQALMVLPYDELPMSKWNGNPYRLDGGNSGRSEDDGAYFLLPYWMGRYHQLIGE